MKVKAEFKMNLARRLTSALWIALSALALSPLSARAQSCQTSSDLDDATRNAVTSAGQRYFGLAARGDVASMRQNSIPSLASDFGGIEGPRWAPNRADSLRAECLPRCILFPPLFPPFFIKAINLCPLRC